MKTVKEISELTGVSIRALRYYDEIGLLEPTGRTEAGYRLYDEQALEKLRAIVFLKELDIPLEEIKKAVKEPAFNYKELLKTYREIIVQKQKRIQGLMEVIDGMSVDDKDISFTGFQESDVQRLSEYIRESTHRQERIELTNETDRNEIGIEELVRKNLTEGKAGFELIQIYGSKEKYMNAVEESSENLEYNQELLEELKELYFSFKEISCKGDISRAEELVRKLEDNTKKLYRTENARYILLKVAEDYLAESKNALVIDKVYGGNISGIIGKAIRKYYGVE